MTDPIDPRPPVSEITEIRDSLPLMHLADFLRAVLIGGLAGGVPYLVFTLPLGAFWLADGNLVSAVIAGLLPLWFTTGATLIAALVIGLPLTALLHRAELECRWRYGLAGLVFGFAIPFATILAVDNSWEAALFLAVPGTIAGAVTGYLWGRARTRPATAGNSEIHTPNPIHDLIY